MRAVGVVRVSQVSGREGESFHSPDVQRAAIHTLAGREGEGWEVLAVHEELDVSGNALLEDRPGLSQAVTAVQTGSAAVIAAAFTERLWWNAEVRAQVLRLVESHGGEVWSADEGRLSNASAAEEFTGTTRTAADRFSRRQNAEKSRAAVLRSRRARRRAVAEHPARLHARGGRAARAQRRRGHDPGGVRPA
jgi:DNA invertase Pin-like site-specific DNA recombinase